MKSLQLYNSNGRRIKKIKMKYQVKIMITNIHQNQNQEYFLRKAYTHSSKKYFVLYLINSKAATTFCKIDLYSAK